MRRLRGLQVVGLAAGEAAADGAEHFFCARVGGVSATRRLRGLCPAQGCERAQAQNAGNASAAEFFERAAMSAARSDLTESLNAKPPRRRA